MINEKTALDIYNCIQDMHHGKDLWNQLEVLSSPKDHSDIEKVFDMVYSVNEWSQHPQNLHPLMERLKETIKFHMGELDGRLIELNEQALIELQGLDRLQGCKIRP